MKKKILFSTFVCLLMGLALNYNFYSKAQELDKDKINLKMNSPLKQGGSIIIELETNKLINNPTITFMNRTYNFYKQTHNTYRAILGIDALVRPGKYVLTLNDKSELLNETRELTVTNAKFPIQNIVISSKKAGIQPSKVELEKVDSAKNNISKESYWSSKKFIIPVKGCEISVYGVNRYHNGKPTGDYHKGQDIKAPQGADIVSTAGGKVLIAEQFNLHGGTVSIDHGQGLMSIYIHMSKILVKEGQILKPGERIGTVGSTGFATGPHLHWGIYVNGIPVNPTEWIGQINRCK